MIVVACPEINRVNFEWHLNSQWGAPLRGRLRQLSYGEIFASRSLPRGAWVMTGLDQLTPAGREAAGLVADQLIAAGVPLLNHPLKVRLRQDLLDTLHGMGLNRFRSVRAAAYQGDLRFPVFVREENRHTGNLTPVLENEDQLQRTLLQLRLRGFALEELLIVEFCDTSRDGVFYKYAVYNVNGTLLAKNKQASSGWMVKASMANSDQTLIEQVEYIHRNPHREYLARIFQIAGIDYGRADFAELDGAVQVWEINTSPTIKRLREASDKTPRFLRAQEIMRPGLSVFYDGFHRAFTAFNLQSADGPSVPCAVPASLVADWQREARRRNRFIWRRERMTWMASNPLVGTTVRAVAPLLRRALYRIGW